MYSRTSIPSLPFATAPSSDMHRALRHYKRAIAAPQGEDYESIPNALRTDLLQRLAQERDALLQRMEPSATQAKRLPSGPATVCTVDSKLPRLFDDVTHPRQIY